MTHERQQIHQRGVRVMEKSEQVISATALITTFYGSQRAKRSRVPLINHIHEGLVVLRAYDAGVTVRAAYCVHPIAQNGDYSARMEGYDVRPHVWELAAAYTTVANRVLKHTYAEGARADYPLSSALRLMLIADKVQNKKDFMKHHFGLHPDSALLKAYFDHWLAALGVSDDQYQKLVNLIERENP